MIEINTDQQFTLNLSLKEKAKKVPGTFFLFKPLANSVL
jgi:hypothetical protein